VHWAMKFALEAARARNRGSGASFRAIGQGSGAESLDKGRSLSTGSARQVDR
jgi:hypothetical protein